MTSTTRSTVTTSLVPTSSPTCSSTSDKSFNETVAGFTGQVCFVPVTPQQFNISSCCLNSDVRELRCQSLCVASLAKGVEEGQKVSVNLTMCLKNLFEGANVTGLITANTCYEFDNGTEILPTTRNNTNAAGSVHFGAIPMYDGLGMGTLLILLAWALNML